MIKEGGHPSFSFKERSNPLPQGMGCFTVFRSIKKKNKYEHHPTATIKSQQSTPAVLPEPQFQNRRSLQSAPPSFKVRTSAPTQPLHQKTYSRSRTFSAPSSLNMAERDALSSIENVEHEDPQSHQGAAAAVFTKERRSPPTPQPLPLPSRHSDTILKNMASFKAQSTSSDLLSFSGPLPLPPSGGLKKFTYEEIAAACQQFSPDRCMSEGLSSVIYKASFGDDKTGSKKLEATVTRLLSSTQGIKEFISEVNTLSSLQHPQLCKLIGFHTREGSDLRMLVYERLFHGSLDLLLYGRSDGPPIDWSTRMKVALCAAQGLAFLHEEGPFQAMYNDFSTANIQIDKDFSAKLSGYGCVSHSSEAEIPNTSPAVANLPAETLERGLLTPKSNVWSFGLVLLELLTGRKNLDCRHPKEERNLVKWSRPFLADDCRLSLIMDPRLKGRFPAKAVRTVADIALKCLHKDPTERPTMRRIVESLENIQDMKYSCRFPLLEPSTIAGKQTYSRSPSLNGIVNQAPSGTTFSTSLSPPLPSRTTIRPISVSPTRPPLEPMSQLFSPRFSTVQRDALKGF